MSDKDTNGGITIKLPSKAALAIFFAIAGFGWNKFESLTTQQSIEKNTKIEDRVNERILLDLQQQIDELRSELRRVNDTLLAMEEYDESGDRDDHPLSKSPIGKGGGGIVEDSFLGMSPMQPPPPDSFDERRPDIPKSPSKYQSLKQEVQRELEIDKFED